MLKTIQMTIDETMLAEVDEAVAEMETTRSAYIRQVLDRALKLRRLDELRRQDEEGYRLLPQQDDEWKGWDEIRHWGDEWNEEK